MTKGKEIVSGEVPVRIIGIGPYVPSDTFLWTKEYGVEEVARIGRERLGREVQIGLDEIEFGALAPLDVPAIKRKARVSRDGKIA